MSVNYAKQVAAQNIPQSQPLPGKAMVPNDAGGFGFEISDAELLDRFIVLGTAGGTHYAKEQKLTQEAAAVVIREIHRDGFEVVRKIIDVSVNARAHRQQPAIFALALCIKEGSLEVRKVAIEKAVLQVCRTATSLFTLVSYLREFRCFGRAVKTGLQAWLTNQKPEDLAYQVAKYSGGREGWTWVDFLRYIHIDPRKTQPQTAELLRWIMRHTSSKHLDVNVPEANPDFRVIQGSETIKLTRDPSMAAALIRKYKLTREMVPSELQKSPEVWEALLENMPYGALLRNITTLARVGLLVPGRFDIINQVTSMLRNKEAITHSKTHPMAILIAARTYAFGHSFGVHAHRESTVWPVVGEVEDALTDAFYEAFGNLPATGKRLLVAVDFSASMGSPAGDTPLSACEASAALALAYGHSEPNVSFLGFATSMKPLDISKKQRLDDVIRMVNRICGEGTDCAVPIKYAMAQHLAVDAFLILTDSQSWAGDRHVSVALEQYRRQTNIPAKMIVVQMVYNEANISDPNDPLSLNVVGFDGATPAAITSFLTL